MKISITVFLSAVLGAGLIAVTAPAHGATLTVTSSADSGAGTLRDTLTNAANGDTINFSITGTIKLTNGELLVTNNVTILGPGPTHLAVDGNASSRLFHAQGGITATIAGLTITNGAALGDYGGGIYNDQSMLAVSNCILSGNTARYGGSLFNDGGYSGGIPGSATLSVSDSIISNSTAGVLGGGIYNNGSGGSAMLTVTNSTFSGNSAGKGSIGHGGGIYNNGQNSGRAMVSVNASNFIGNSAPSGAAGGIYNDAGTLTVSNCTLSRNSAGYPGGGAIVNGGTLSVSTSTLSGNGASSSGGGIYNYGMLTVSTSTLSGNSAGAVGGGIINDGSGGSTSTAAVITSTLSGNSALYGGAIYNHGPGSSNTTLRINASTICSNTASFGGGIFNDGSSGGHATLEIGDTVLSAGASYPNLTNELGTVISHGYNLSSDGGGGLLTGTNDQIRTNPMLGPLANNGGPTFTHALLSGSPAIDKGKRDAIPTLALTTDQRGQPRPFDFPSITNAPGGDGSDIGAFEAGPPPLSIMASRTNIVLSWLAAGPGFRLESATNPTASNVWIFVSGMPVTLSNHFYVTNPPNAPHIFYRLIYP